MTARYRELSYDVEISPKDGLGFTILYGVAVAETFANRAQEQRIGGPANRTSSVAASRVFPLRVLVLRTTSGTRQLLRIDLVDFMSASSYRVDRLKSDRDHLQTIEMFTAYADSLGIDLSFQDFAAELVSFPGKYAPPSGSVLLARSTRGEPLGCVAVRPLSAGCCEMKRLYVRPEGRGRGLGRALVSAIVKEAERIGYKTMKLDTLSTMTGAIRLYRQQGFVDAQAYYDTPVAGTVFLQRRLESG